MMEEGSGSYARALFSFFFAVDRWGMMLFVREWANIYKRIAERN